MLFYCHFPDLLLAQRRSHAHSAYRAPLDYAEQATTGMADRLLVNSHYTKGLYERMLLCMPDDGRQRAVQCCMLGSKQEAEKHIEIGSETHRTFCALYQPHVAQ